MCKFTWFFTVFLLPRTNYVTTFIVVILNHPNIWKLECITEISAKKVWKKRPQLGKFSLKQFFKVRNIYSLKSHNSFINRSFVKNIACITPLFAKIMPNTPVLKPKIQRVHRTAILNFGRSTRCFVLFIKQVNHMISNFRMIQSCIVSMQVATCAVTK